jgi:N-formylglutamate amidohydrolase
MDRFDQKASTLGPVEPEAPPAPCDQELSVAFEVGRPRNGAGPVVFSSAHSGRVYPAAFIASSKLDPLTLRRSEDAFVDELFGAAPELGAILLRAHFPRAYLDVNREPYELDPRMFEGRLPAFANTRSIRVAGGLGAIARVVGEGREIYARKLTVEEGLARIESLYKPWHRGLRGLLQQAWRRHGVAVLVDCHSMPSNAGRADRIKADIVLGDRYGASCDPLFTEVAESRLRALGYAVARNKPYAGGFITEHYGDPAAGWHALQIEINRGLYMDEATIERSPGFEELQNDLREVMQALIEAAAGLGERSLAAE